MISANTHTIRLEYKRGNAWFLVNILVGVLLFLPVVSASDVQVWQGQYFKGTVFQVGTFPFNFSVYNDKFGGNACYSSSVNLTTGNFGEWRTEQTSVGMACDNTSSDYYLEIIINGEIQSPRRLMKNFDFLRKKRE